MRYNLKTLSDDELIALYRDGNKDVIDFLIDKYKELVRIKARSMFILGGDTEDLVQEGMIGLFKAIRDYDSSQGAKFRTFADICVSRQMFTAIESANSKKHSPLNAYVSIDDDAKAAEASAAMGVLLNDIAYSDPEDLLIDVENVRRLETRIYELLSPLERQVYELRLTGMGYVEIAGVLGKEDKSIDNALARIKSKVKKIVEE